MDFFLFFSIFAVVMMTAIGGLLTWLHLRLGQLKSAANQMPMMEEKFTKTLMGARTEMQELDKFAKEQLPGIDEKISAARKAIDEIDYMINRTEKAMDKAEVTLSQLKTATPDAGTVEMSATQAPIAPAPVATKVVAKPQSVQQQAYSASAQLGSVPQAASSAASVPSAAQKQHDEPALKMESMRPKSALKADGTPSYATESMSRSEMAARNKQSSAEQSLRDSLAEILK